MAHLSDPDESWSEPRLRRVSRLVRWCVRAVVATAVFAVGFSVARLVRYGNQASGGIAGSVGLAAVTVCITVPYLVYTHNVKRRLAAMAKAHAESPAVGPMSQPSPNRT